MRNIITYAVLLSTMLLVFSCKQNLQTYDDPINRLNFYYPSNPSDSTTRYTFVFEEDDFVRDTVWLQVRTMGFLSDSDREISVKQIEVEGELNAKPGDHYVALDDPEYKAKWMKVKANENLAELPIVVFRHEDLKEGEFSLLLEIQVNDNFSSGYPYLQRKKVTIADIPVRPSLWDGTAAHYFLGPYGPTKHLFLIDVLRDMNLKADDNFIKLIMPQNPPDMGETAYWANLLNDKLLEENQRRLDNGQELLHEGDYYADDTKVYFCVNSTALPNDPREL